MNDDSQKMIKVLRTAMQILGLRQSQVERALGWHVSSLSKLFGGKAELRFEHVVDISAAMGLKPQEILRLAYPSWGEPPSEAGQRVREITGKLAPPNPPAAQPEARLTEKDLERMVARTMRRVLGQRIEQALTGAADTAED